MLPALCYFVLLLMAGLAAGVPGTTAGAVAAISCESSDRERKQNGSAHKNICEFLHLHLSIGL